jgi:tetratricopeptide (TPR) repeat protein
MGIMAKDLFIQHKMKAADNFIKQGKPLHAIQIFQALIEDYPEDTESYFSLAELYSNIGKPESAFSVLQQLLEEQSDAKEARIYLSQLYIKNNLWDEAIETLSFLMPEEDPIICFLLGYSYFMLKDFELAKINYLDFLIHCRESELLYEAQFQLAKIEVELQNFNGALEYLKKAEVMLNNFWELKLTYAVCYYNLGMYAHAVTPIESSIRLNPKEPSVYGWGGKIYLKLGDYLKAEKYFRKQIDLSADISSDAYTGLAEACLKNKKINDALNYFDIALKIDPENISAKDGKKFANSLNKKLTASDAK